MKNIGILSALAGMMAATGSELDDYMGIGYGSEKPKPTKSKNTAFTRGAKTRSQRIRANRRKAKAKR